MARHELGHLAGIVETNTTILKAQHGDRTEWLTTVDSLQKQESRHAPMSCGRARELDYGVRKSVKYRRSLIIENSEEQRETARHPAVFSTPRRPKLKHFCGGDWICRRKFSGRTARTARRAARLTSRRSNAPRRGSGGPAHRRRSPRRLPQSAVRARHSA